MQPCSHRAIWKQTPAHIFLCSGIISVYQPLFSFMEMLSFFYFFFFLHARHLADIHAHEWLATSVTRTVKTAGKSKCKEGQGSDIVVTVSLTYFSCESRRILWSGERLAVGFFFFFFLSILQPANTDLWGMRIRPGEAKYTVIPTVFVQACVLLFETLTTSSLREQQHCLVAKKKKKNVSVPVHNEATAKQTVAVINPSSISNLFVPSASFPCFSSTLS